MQEVKYRKEGGRDGKEEEEGQSEARTAGKEEGVLPGR